MQANTVQNQNNHNIELSDIILSGDRCKCVINEYESVELDNMRVK